MNMQAVVLWAVAILLALAPQGWAQGTATPATQDSDALKIVEQAFSRETLLEAIEAKLQNLSGNPEMDQEMARVSIEALRERVDWKVLHRDAAKVYEQTFTPEELSAIRAFIEGDVGRKWVSQMPAMETKLEQVVNRHFEPVMAWVVDQARASAANMRAQAARLRAEEARLRKGKGKKRRSR